MTPDDETLMAYADGELDPLGMKRVERALAADPALAERVAAHRRLRAALGGAFAGVADEPVPERLERLVRNSVAPLPVQRGGPRWILPTAIAAALALGVGLGTQIGGSGPIVERGGTLVASGELGRTLDRQLAAADGDTRVLLSFRDGAGRICRVFNAPVVDGVACREGGSWMLIQTRTGAGGRSTEYRQAGSAASKLLAEAQDMMAGEPLDAAAERRARASDWR